MLAEPITQNPSKFNYNDTWSIPRDRTEWYLTHDFHAYFASFPPQLVSRLIQHHTKPNDVIFDPFMGGGSTVVEGVMANLHSIGSDISPLSKLIAQVKATPIKIKDDDVLQLLTSIKRSLSRRKPANPEKYDRVHNIQKWFTPENLTELDSIYNRILSIENVKFRNFATVAFSSILRKSSNAKNAEQHLCIKNNKNPESPFRLFSSKLELMKLQMDMFYKRCRFNHKAQLYVHDVRQISKILPGNYVDIVVTSPPYGTGSKYTNIYKLSYEWLGFKKPNSSQSMELARDFHNELSKGLLEIHHVLKPNKFCFLVYGDPSTDTGLTKKAVMDAKEIGFKHRGTISCPIKKIKSKHHVKYTQSIPKDFILILQKQN